MTDNEIIEALECHLIVDGDCKGCPLDGIGGCFICSEQLAENALNLINRQKAEIERLEYKQNKEYAIISSVISQAKAEAVKEFAERLKPKLGFGNYMSYAELDNLVKEMVGDG